jgi:hypothetical protein
VSDGLTEIIPDLHEAREEETQKWDEAFILDAPAFIMGIEVRQFTLRHFSLLTAIKSPFLRNGPLRSTDVAIFLWTVSPEREQALRVRDVLEHVSNKLGALVFSFMRYRFVKRLRKLNANDTATAIEAYLDDALYSAPKGGGSGGTAPYWSMHAGFVGLIASEFGWTEDKILSLPTNRGFQYLAFAKKSRDPDAKLFRPSDATIGKWLRETNERIAAEQKAKANREESSGL